MNRSRNRIEIRVEIGLNKEGTATGTLNHRVLSVTKTFRFLELDKEAYYHDESESVILLTGL